MWVGVGNFRAILCSYVYMGNGLFRVDVCTYVVLFVYIYLFIRFMVLVCHHIAGRRIWWFVDLIA